MRNRGSTCGRSGVQRLRLWCRARSARPRPGCRIGAQAPGAARHLGAERVARGGDGSQRLCAPPGTQARSALGAQRRAPSGDQADQARRRRRARSAHATGAERVARGDASWHAGAARASSRSSNAGRLLPASATLTSFVGGLKTMSPAPGRRPPIFAYAPHKAIVPLLLQLAGRRHVAARRLYYPSAAVWSIPHRRVQPYLLTLHNLLTLLWFVSLNKLLTLVSICQN